MILQMPQNVIRYSNLGAESRNDAVIKDFTVKRRHILQNSFFLFLQLPSQKLKIIILTQSLLQQICAKQHKCGNHHRHCHVHIYCDFSKDTLRLVTKHLQCGVYCESPAKPYFK